METDCLAGLTGFELPEDDSSNSHQLPENGPTTLAAFTPIRQVLQSDGQNTMWRFESSHPSHAFVSPQAKLFFPMTDNEVMGARWRRVVVGTVWIEADQLAGLSARARSSARRLYIESGTKRECLSGRGLTRLAVAQRS